MQPSKVVLLILSSLPSTFLVPVIQVQCHHSDDDEELWRITVQQHFDSLPIT
jgi:hypothetical protein